MASTTDFFSQISTIQTLISAGVSAFFVVLGILIQQYFAKKNSTNNYIIDKGYGIHKRLRDNLRSFLRSDVYRSLSLPNKVSKEDKIKLNSSFQSYLPESVWEEVTLYQDQFENFEKELIGDILKVSTLSVRRIQKIATKIENLYEQTKEGEDILNELFQEEFFNTSEDYARPLTDKEKNYWRLKQEIHKKIFWIEAQQLLLKLETEIERVVRLKL